MLLQVRENVYDKAKGPVKVNVNDYYVYLEEPEELIVKYLSAWKYWRSELVEIKY